LVKSHDERITYVNSNWQKNKRQRSIKTRYYNVGLDYTSKTKHIYIMK